MNNQKYKLFGAYEFGTSTNTYLQKPTDTELSNLGLQRSGLYTESVRKFWKTEEALQYVNSIINPPAQTETGTGTGTDTGATTQTPPEYVISTSISDDGQGLITVSTRKEQLEKTPEEDTTDEGTGDGEGSGGEGGGEEGGSTMKPRPVRDVKSISTSMAIVKDNVLLHINATEEQKGYLSMYIGGATGFELIPTGNNGSGATTYTMLKNKLSPTDALVNFCRLNPTINLPVITVTISYTAKTADNVAGGQKYPGKVPQGMSAICTSVTSSPVSGNKRKKSYVETWQMGYFNNTNSALIKQYTGIEWPPASGSII